MKNIAAPAAHHSQPPLFFGDSGGIAETGAGREGAGWCGGTACGGAAGDDAACGGSGEGAAGVDKDRPHWSQNCAWVLMAEPQPVQWAALSE